MRELEGRVAAVTGAAGGIGRAAAIALAEAGMDVALADLDEPGMQAVAAEIKARGRRAICVPTDVTQARALENLLARTLAELGSCHLMVNNAGVFQAAPLLEATEAEWRRVIDVNLWGVLHGSRVFGHHFVAQGAGHIVNTSSAAGLFPMPGMCSYSTTKAAIVLFSNQLRWELAASGVGVTVLVPGVVKTRIFEKPGVGLEHVDMEQMTKHAPSPEGLARKLVRAVRRDQALVKYGAASYILSALRWLPWWLLDPIGRFMARTAVAVVRPQAGKVPAKLPPA
jgi:NAD(P)-dependent dehydrogenase (short-subunit alcohol dehydrogenase family)